MPTTHMDTPGEPRVSTGVIGLDHLLQGGLTPDRMYLVEGSPGAGKTTLAMQFLIEGRRQNETGPVCHAVGDSG